MFVVKSKMDWHTGNSKSKAAGTVYTNLYFQYIEVAVNNTLLITATCPIDRGFLLFKAVSYSGFEWGQYILLVFDQVWER